MNVPQFTAEASLYKTSSYYHMVATFGEANGFIQPGLTRQDFTRSPKPVCEPCHLDYYGNCGTVCIDGTDGEAYDIDCPPTKCPPVGPPCPAGNEQCGLNLPYNTNFVCCPPGQQCCDPENHVCCPGECCGPACCSDDQGCTSDGCCPKDNVCGHRCCAPGVACSPVDGCCQPGEVICGDNKCCPPNHPGAGIRWTNYPNLFTTPVVYKWLVVECQYADVPGIPAELDTFIRQFLGSAGAGYGNIVDYFHDVSYNGVAFAADFVGWVTAPFKLANALQRSDRVTKCLQAIPSNQPLILGVITESSRLTTYPVMAAAPAISGNSR